MTIKEYFALLYLREKLSKSSSAVTARAIEIIDKDLNIKDYD